VPIDSSSIELLISVSLDARVARAEGSRTGRACSSADRSTPSPPPAPGLPVPSSLRNEVVRRCSPCRRRCRRSSPPRRPRTGQPCETASSALDSRRCTPAEGWRADAAGARRTLTRCCRFGEERAIASRGRLRGAAAPARTRRRDAYRARAAPRAQPACQPAAARRDSSRSASRQYTNRQPPLARRSRYLQPAPRADPLLPTAAVSSQKTFQQNA